MQVGAALAAGAPWVLGAAAVAAAGARPSRSARVRPRPSLQPSLRPSLPAVAAASVATLCLLVLGPVIGALLAVPLGPGAAWWARRAHRPAAPDDGALPLALDLAAAVLRSGRSAAEALWAAAPVCPAYADRLRRVSAQLQLGAAPADAWAVFARAGPLESVARFCVRSGTSGIRVAAALEQEATELRAGAHGRRLTAAHRAGVTVLAPLGVCFLPAFVCLGIVPVVAGVLATSGLAGT